jgi:aspartyl-tRNA(Asn)/glutamyl-tRNA(Gln) amidotransferase subunit C
LVNEEEIIRVAELMKIDLEDHGEHVNRVKKMLEYFDILDQIDLSSEEIKSQEKSLTELRKDEFIPNDKKLIESLKNFREHYVRAPKMN